jgi:hypothetical protein
MFTIGSKQALYDEHDISPEQQRAGMSFDDDVKHTAIEQVMARLSKLELESVAVMVKRYEDEPTVTAAEVLVARISSHMERANTQARGYLLWTTADASVKRLATLPQPLNFCADIAEQLIRDETSAVQNMLKWQKLSRSEYAQRIYDSFVKTPPLFLLSSSDAVLADKAIALEDDDDGGDRIVVVLDGMDGKEIETVDQIAPRRYGDERGDVLLRVVDDMMTRRVSMKEALKKKAVYKKIDKVDLQQRCFTMAKAAKNMFDQIKTKKIPLVESKL